MAEILRVEGLAEVQLKLAGLPVQLRNKVMYRLLRKAAAPIVRAARANAPVARRSTRRVIPGLLRRTITVTRSRFENPKEGHFGVFIQPRVPGKIKSLQRRAKQAGKAVNFGDPFYYRFQEFGFHAVGRRRIKGGTRRRAATLATGTYPFIPGLKFLGRAFESQRHAALGVIKADLVAAIIEQFNASPVKGKR